MMQAVMRDVSAVIATARQRLAAGNPVALVPMYGEQMRWAQHYNTLIWSIAALLVPASVAGFVLDFTDKNGHLDGRRIVATALASSLLLFFWLLLASWHRRLWTRSFILAGLIEEQWKIREPSDAPRVLSSHLLGGLTPTDWGPYIRKLLVLGVWLAWALRLMWALGGTMWLSWVLIAASALLSFQMVYSARRS